MLSKSLAIKVLNEALATGGDYAEIYVEKTVNSSVVLENGVVESSAKPQLFGVGIRILNGFRSVYGYTSDVSAKSLLLLASQLAASYHEERKITVISIAKQRIRVVNKVEDPCIETPFQDKIALLREAYDIIHAVDPRIVRIQTGFADNFRNIEIYNAEGEVGKLFVTNEQRGRLFFAAIAAEGNDIQSYFSGPGRCDGWHYFEKELNWRQIAKETGEKAIMMLSAKECPSGRFPVVITNGWGGVLFHESCGHPLEASATAKGLSVFSDSIGKQIASPIVSAYDDGSLPNEWGSNNIDTEGVACQKNQLIKDGICVGFMVDRLNGRRINMAPNGTSRRQNYQYEPTSRMSNTYIAPGKDNPEDIIKDTKLGIYVTNFGGGSVDPVTGEFNFSASEAYIIRDGKVCEPVKGCTLIGSGKEVLMSIDRVGNDLDLGQGNCGASSGLIPVNVGQPTIRLKEITVGGRGGKLE